MPSGYNGKMGVTERRRRGRTRKGISLVLFLVLDCLRGSTKRERERERERETKFLLKIIQFQNDCRIMVNVTGRSGAGLLGKHMLWLVG